MRTPIDRGLTATPAYTPFGGYARLDRLVKRLASADMRTAAWAVFLWASSAGAVTAMWFHGYRLPPIWVLLVLGAVAAVADRQSVAVTDRTWMSVSFVPLVFSAVAFGPLGGFAVGAVSNVGDLRESRLRWGVNTPIRGLTAAAAGLAASGLAPRPTTFGACLLSSLLASVALLAADSLLLGMTVWLRRGSVREVLRTTISVSLLIMPLYIPVLALFVYGYHLYSLRLVLV
ncbi:MAG: hypothetical protein ACREMY_28910, partial [bacterium]